MNGDRGAYFRCLFLTRAWRLAEATSRLRSTVISRERPLAEVPGRCDAVAVAVGLTDRKHVGVVGANRDAAAAKGDREYLHPVHISAPLEPQGFPRRLLRLWCAELPLSFLFSFSFFLFCWGKTSIWNERDAQWMLWPTVWSRSVSSYCVSFSLQPETPWWSSRNYEDCCCNGVDSLTAQTPSVNLQHPVSWRFAGWSVPWASPRFFSELLYSYSFFLLLFWKCNGKITTTARKTMNEEMTKSEEQHLSLQKALQQCELVQNMIDISISSLEGLRTKCATSNDLTQKEIRTLEVSTIWAEWLKSLLCILIWINTEGLSPSVVSF